MTPPLQVLHVYTHFAKMGGVEAVLRREAGKGSDAGVEHRFCVIFETGDSGRVLGLGMRPWHSPANTRRAWEAKCGGRQADVAIYHNAWGMSFLAGSDSARRRIALFHSTWPGVESQVDAVRPMIDAAWAVSRPLQALCRDRLGLAEARLVLLRCPIDPPPGPARPHPPMAGRPLRFGFVGRVENRQKRVERLPVLAKALRSAGVDQLWEILGEGPALPGLRRAFADLGIPATFHGRRSGAAYWETLAHWDFAVLTSDYEGTPLGLLEAMSQGALPLCQANGSGSDDCATAVDPKLLFRPGDYPAAAAAIREVCGSAADRSEGLRDAARRAAAAHSSGAWDRGFRDALDSARALPRLSDPRPGYRGSLIGFRLPYALLGRLSPRHPWRRGLG